MQEILAMTGIKKGLYLLLTLVLLLNTVAVGGIFGFSASAADSLTLINGSTLKISGNYLMDIVAGTSASTIIGNFVENVTVTKASGVAVSDTSVVCTGYIVANGSAKLSIVISGDVSLDGSIDSTDLMGIESCVSNGVGVAGAKGNAADINSDGIISSVDVLFIQNHVGGGESVFKRLYGAKFVLSENTAKYASASDAKAGTNSTGTAAAGTYYVYKAYPHGLNGMYNITTDSTGAVAGFWVNLKDSSSAVTGTPYAVVTTINKYASSSDALNKINPTGTIDAGTYYIYNAYPNGYNGMYNLTLDTTGATAGFWINPNENVKKAATYVLIVDVPKYGSAANAVSKVNSTGTATAGTYYIYSGYPQGLNGMYNLTTDPTGDTAGFWINPSEISSGFVNANGTVKLSRNINKYSSSTDAAHQTNITGTVDKSTTYYVYKNYPNGVNGVYNITTDPTGATAGCWVNPVESLAPKLNYNTVKAVWISQYEINSMIRNYTGQYSKSTFTSKVNKALTAAKETGFNTIMVQVRPNGDSFYPSSYYPYSKYIVGSYGNTSSYDPFQVIIDEAQKLALSVHAWVNPLRLMSTSEIASVSSSYLIKQWYNSSSYKGTYIVAYNGTYYLNPAYEAVRNLIIDGVEEICNNYNVDGIHFDDYFYPTTDASFDQAAFTASGQLSRGTFRRSCVNLLVKGVYSAVKAIDDDIIFGISPSGNITNNMDMYYADVKTWANNEGYVDYLAPQLYWGFQHTVSPYETALASWVNLIGAKDYVKLIVGLDLSMASGETDSYDGTEWSTYKDVIARQISVSSTKENFAGVCLFSMQYYYNVSSGAYVSGLTAERQNFTPVIKALYVD